MTSRAFGSDEPQDGRSASDLWSIPAGAVELDDAALWGNGDILNRLSAVLPEVAHPESGSASPGAARGRTGTRRTRRAAEAAIGKPGKHRKAIIVVTLAVSFCVAVLVGTLLSPTLLEPGRPGPNGSGTPASPASDSWPITDGPSECPMYTAPPEGPAVPPGPQSGGCFFVG
jgi:hypothetical protein